MSRFPTAWRECVGTGRMELALRRDYQDSLALIQREIGFRHLRGHGLFSDGMGIHRPYVLGGERRVRHAFTYLDQVVDAYLELGIRPFLELGFMPSGLASGDQTVFWWGGNVTPPASHTEWADLIGATLRHLIARYGIDEVRGWPIEVWNEPNLPQFWQDADADAYHHLYEVSANAVKDVDAALQVGGPAISPGDDKWLETFAAFVSRHDVPIDFVSRHAYTSGPARHVPFGVHQSLAPASALLEQFALPRKQLAGTPLGGLPVHITEFNSSYRPDNPVHDTAFHAAYLAPVLAGGGDLCDSFAYWTFSDMFEEEGVPTALFHGGFGLLTHRQIKKPIFHLYAFLARLAPEFVSRGPDHLVTADDSGRVTILAWAPVDHTDAANSPATHHVLLSVPAPGPAVFLLRSSVDDERGNAWSAWREMGRPLAPSPRQVDMLREAAEPARVHRNVPVVDGRAEIEIVLARHEVTLLELTPVVDETPPWWDDSRLVSGDEQ
ncbi:xylan 1,4-beta-xylosidase [Actinoplanes campanulatus]|uniref:Xylan 1,4-beta-xylosidase n=1 Tax=Actinoplanes campanulatus TaxID=113559 RepID=A0A7W5FJY0_9ACTN|nr:xylan 1,4-beta-xylosidase [Actinoplanes campanulatus]MBB3101126.1 xylan 1,4-beta-xylosidase [Actinoplanes campanulatus]GGN51014.1 beta-xylosidase [Actinoplanes campanulatus]GID42571.1 beta-xylosidase [Actinoplanes campanulatus]